MRCYCYRTDVNMNTSVMMEIALNPIYRGVHTFQLHKILI